MLNKGKIVLTAKTEDETLILNLSTYTRTYRLIVTYLYTMNQPELITYCKVIQWLEHTLLKDYSTVRILDNPGLTLTLLTLPKASYFALHELLLLVKHAGEGGKYIYCLTHMEWPIEIVSLARHLFFLN